MSAPQDEAAEHRVPPRRRGLAVLVVLLAATACMIGAAALAVYAVISERDADRARGLVPVSSGGVTSVCLADGSGLRLWRDETGRPFAVTDGTGWSVRDPYGCVGDR